MSQFFLRGALVEYGSDVLGPLPNVVVFQFNPEEIPRTLNFPGQKRAVGEKARTKEPSQAPASPQESFRVTAAFSAADDLGQGGAAAAVPRVVGVGPQLAALEKMVYPKAGLVSELVGEAVDAIGDALGAGGKKAATRAVPRQQLPRILFIWGPSRILPVRITSMSIKEQKFDMLLNPVQAEVQIGLEVASFPKGSKDRVGQGALLYTETVKEGQALLNLARSAEYAAELIPF